MKVPRAEYTKTSTQSSDILGKNVITSLSTDSTKRMATLTQVLRTEYLWDLVTGLRAPPTPTPDNIHGFTAGSNKFDPVTSQLILVKDDDIYHYDYDCRGA